MNQPQVAAMSTPAQVCHVFRLHDVSTLRMWSPVLVKQYYFIVQEQGSANSSCCKPHGPQLCL